MNKTRIGLNDTMMDAVVKMADGNPGAITVIMRMITEGKAIDPDDFMGGLGSVLALDTHGIYGHEIWRLYKDLCGESLVTTIGALRAVQLGYLSEAKLKSAINNPSELSDLDTYVAKVRERLPDFAK